MAAGLENGKGVSVVAMGALAPTPSAFRFLVLDSLPMYVCDVPVHIHTMRRPHTHTHLLAHTRSHAWLFRGAVAQRPDNDIGTEVFRTLARDIDWSGLGHRDVWFRYVVVP